MSYDKDILCIFNLCKMAGFFTQEKKNHSPSIDNSTDFTETYIT